MKENKIKNNIIYNYINGYVYINYRIIKDLFLLYHYHYLFLIIIIIIFYRLLV